MDKIYTKIIIDRAGISQAKSEYIRKFKDKYIYIDKNFNEEPEEEATEEAGEKSVKEECESPEEMADESTEESAER